MKILITLTGLASFLGLTSFSCAAEGAQAGSARVGDGPRSAISASGHDLRPLSEEHIAEIAKQLSPLQAKVALNAGTERAFTGETWDEKRPGTYVSIVGGLPLFRSDDKFDSGTGWPSFTRPVDPAHVVLKRDATHGMVRTEVLDARSGAHLGHVFDDGPRPTGKRYCINSASLRFIPDGEPLPEESQPLPLEKAYFAGGCFWGVEDVFEQIPGVVSAVSGYMGGQLEKPTYKAICRGDTGHAETVEITFAPAIASYEALLKVFFDNHDPTTLNRQGPDFGEQYRSAIFAADAAQQQAAKKFVADLAKTERFTDRRIVTQILAPGAPFWPAEEYHQDYHQKHGGSCKVKVY